MNVINSTLIAQYAKEMKVSKAKLEAFAQAIVDSQPKKVGCQGKKASSETLALRESILNMVQNMKGCKFTMKELSGKVQATPVNTTVAVNFLVKQGKITIKEAGKLDKMAGERGKKATVWEVV